MIYNLLDEEWDESAIGPLIFLSFLAIAFSALILFPISNFVNIYWSLIIIFALTVFMGEYDFTKWASSKKKRVNVFEIGFRKLGFFFLNAPFAVLLGSLLTLPLGLVVLAGSAWPFIPAFLALLVVGVGLNKEYHDWQVEKNNKKSEERKV